MNNLYMNNNLTQEQEIENNVTPEMQNNFLESSLGKTINGAIDLGIKSLMPDFIENEIIEIKNSFISEGFEEGINTAINNSIELGKNIIGIFNGNFTDINQAEKAVMQGGIIDGISNVIDFVLDKTNKKGILSEEIVNLIKDGKNYLLENMENRIKDNFNIQVSSLFNINNYMELWNNYFSSQDLQQMNETYEKMQDELGQILPLEDVMKSAKEIENLQTIIQNNNGDFELSNEQLELSKLLI